VAIGQETRVEMHYRRSSGRGIIVVEGKENEQRAGIQHMAVLGRGPPLG